MPKKLLLTAITFTFALTAAAGAQPGKMMMHADKLGLSEEQAGQIEKLAFQHQKEMIRLRADLQLARLELREIMVQNKLDEKAALSKQERISGIKAGIGRARLEHKIATRKVLNEEQLAKWNQMRKAEGGRGRDHRGGGPRQFMGECRMHGPGPDMPEPPEPPEAPEND
jgi:Spy/CpxP family protein refolding chaperone